MKKSAFLGLTLAIWVIAIFSLIAVRYLIRRAPRVTDYSRVAKAYFNSLDLSTKRNISLFETSIIRLADGSFRTIGVGFEPELENLVSERRLKTKKIDFFVENPIAIERRMMAGEAFKILNNAEKKCFIDGFGTVMFQNGSYHFIYDEAVYQEYVKKFGTDCKPCEELKKLRNAEQGGNHEQ